MGFLHTLGAYTLRFIYMVASLALIFIAAFLMYKSFQIFMHTSYWLVVSFLILIALSNGLVYFARNMLLV